jgi:putative transposase
MMLVQRRVTYEMFPTPKQEEILETWRALHCELYNAAVEERREAWRTAGVSINYNRQQDQLPEIKEVRSDLEPLGSHALQWTCRRVDHAYRAFFRRLKNGETPGYPRFKSRKRFKGWTWPDPAGWKLVLPEKKGRHRPRTAVLSISNLGNVRIRGRARNEGTPRTCTITKKHGRWYASIVIDCAPLREHGTGRIGFDWGLDSFLTFDDGTGVENPKFVGRELPALKRLSKALKNKKKGSNNWKKAVRKLALFYARMERKRDDFQHKESAKLIKRAAFLATEELDTKQLVEKEDQTPARRRNILDSAPAGFLQKARYKAEEAGAGFVEIPTRIAKPSQRCPECFLECGKKPIWQREHVCPHCGYRGPRDQSSAKLCLLWAEGKRPPGWGSASSAEESARKGPRRCRKPRAKRKALARG